jgi:hypothetical protein
MIAPLYLVGFGALVCNRTTWLSSMDPCGGIPDLVQSFVADGNCHKEEVPQTNGSFMYKASVMGDDPAKTFNVDYWETPGADSCTGSTTSHTSNPVSTCIHMHGILGGTKRIDCTEDKGTWSVAALNRAQAPPSTAIGNWRLCRGTQCCDIRAYTGCYVTPSGSAAVNASSLSFDSTNQPYSPDG